MAVRRRPYHRRELPRYNEALGPTQSTLVVAPPFTYPGVTARVFPLRTNLNLLRGFCDRYLNVARDLYQFVPYVPYVLLVVLDYGRMTLEELNLGWVSQHEVLFEVPLGMWGKEEGRWVFKGWVMTPPFIVVDQAASLTTGREAYGWPKVLAELQFSPERWLMDPRNPTRYLTLDVKGIDSDAPNVRLLEIDQQLGQNPSLAPMDLDMLDPLGRLSRLARTSMSVWRDLVQLLVRPPLAGFRYQGRVADLGSALSNSFRQLSSFLVEPGVDVVTLKQFRDFEHPELACYQALVRSGLSVARYNRGGLLGLDNILRGDITGGFQIRLFEDPAFPIVESLGLQVAQERMVRGRTVSFLEPLFPFWLSVDLTYGTGETLCSRTREYSWDGEPAPKRGPRPGPRFNTVAGGAEQVWRGPYLIPKASFNVYPLEANDGRLCSFLKKYLNLGGQLDIELPRLRDESCKEKGPYVYMVASSNQIFSAARSQACIQSTQIVFYVPLVVKPKRANRTGTGKQFLAVPFAFVDNPALATTMREVQGIPALNAAIESPFRFLRSTGPLLRMRVHVFAALDAGLRSEPQTLLEIVPPEGYFFYEPGPVLDFSQERLMLKQFRDAETPDCACYQSLLREPWTVETSNPLPIDPMEIHVYRYPSLPLVETLGLNHGEPLQKPGGALVDVLTPVGPYKVNMKVEIGLGEEITHSAGSMQWEINWLDLASDLKTRSR